MKLLSRFIATILSLVIVISASAFIVARTIWNPNRIQQAVQTTATASKVAAAIPIILKSTLSLAPDEQFIVKTIVTDKNVSPLLDQVVSSIATSDGTTIKLDLEPFRNQIATEGLPLTKDLDSLTAKPITILSSIQMIR
jgi:hypothetical protein